MKNKKLIALWLPALIIVVIDQITKHLVRTTPSLHNWEIISGWLSFHYTKNPGMALGMDWASTPVISGIAILATIGIIVYIIRSIDRANLGYLTCMGLVLGGAFGNIIDRLLMGYIESNGGVLEGHVIDFIHFTLNINGFAVFPYIFNVADIAISIAIISLLIFHQRILPIEEDEDEDKDTMFSPDNNSMADQQAGDVHTPRANEHDTSSEESRKEQNISISETGNTGTNNLSESMDSDQEE